MYASKAIFKTVFVFLFCDYYFRLQNRLQNDNT